MYILAKHSWNLAETIQKGRDYPKDPGTALQYLFYFFPKTFTSNYIVMREQQKKIEELVRESGEIKVHDVSCGTGSAILALLYLLKRTVGEEAKKNIKLEITLQDLSAPFIEIAEKLVSEFLKGFPVEARVRKLVGDSTRTRPDSKPNLVICSFSLYELFDDSVEEMIVWSKKILKSMDKNGLFFITEPAMKNRNSKFIMMMRNELREHVISPCTHRANCPLIKDDWCHFGLKWEPPFFLTRGLNMMGGRPPDVNFSYLVLTPQKADVDQNTARVISHRLDEKGKIVFWTCEGSGRVKNYVLTKNIRETNRDAEALHIGDVVEIEGFTERRIGEREIGPHSRVRIKQTLVQSE